MNILTDRSMIDEFFNNNKNVVVIIDSYDKEFETDLVVLADKDECDEIDDFIDTIDFECEVSVEDYKTRLNYFKINNEVNMTKLLTSFENHNVLLIRSDSEECEIYFVSDIDY